MVFSSTIFLCVFLPIVLALYFITPGITAKNILLLITSLIFYAWGEPKFIVLMVVSIIGNYIFGLGIHLLHKKGKKGRLILTLSVLFNLGFLFYFKYFNFAATSLAAALGKAWEIAEIALPIGISFYTFQGMSYVIDVYREDITDENEIMVQKDPIKLALYISMFPQLIAGPIVRYSDIRQYLDKRSYSFAVFAEGIEIFIYGMSKKVLFANLLGEVATSIMETNVTMISMPQAWLGAICYSLQIFYDFCGYSEMAIGLGKMLGFEFMKNFEYPYISRSITEFWRRWHISLSGWFRDYLYIPLGGNRRGNVYFNLTVVFLATGIWHGAAWGFIIWGLWHGLFMLIERILKKHPIPVKVKLPKFITSVAGWGYSMFIVMIGWVLFRIVDLPQTINYFKIMFGRANCDFIKYDLDWYLNSRTLTVLIIAVFCCFPWKAIIAKCFSKSDTIWKNPCFILVKRIFLIGMMLLCFLMITNSTYNPFIYFRF